MLTHYFLGVIVRGCQSWYQLFRYACLLYPIKQWNSYIVAHHHLAAVSLPLACSCCCYVPLYPPPHTHTHTHPLLPPNHHPVFTDPSASSIHHSITTTNTDLTWNVSCCCPSITNLPIESKRQRLCQDFIITYHLLIINNDLFFIQLVSPDWNVCSCVIYLQAKVFHGNN